MQPYASPETLAAEAAVLTPSDVRSAKRVRSLACLTAYDYPTARLVDEAGADVILVGDSLGMVVLGHPDTTFVTMDDMRHHVRAAARGVKRALLVGDLPYHSYQTPAQAVENARRLRDAGAVAVKLEGGVAVRAQIEAIVADGIPLMAHLGMLPQQVREEGGYRIKGRTEEGAEALLADARAVEEAGAFSVVLELVTPPVARRITEEFSIPTIGIGAGADCDGQILVTHDLVGLFPWFTPKFVRPLARVGEAIRDAARTWVAEVRGEGPRG